MAEYTIGIWDILQRADIDLSNMNNMTEASKQEIFGSLINYIKAEYQDQFALGFALHFRQEEIGFETETEWRYALAEKMVNGADWINEVYEHLEKQIFSQYTVTESDQHNNSTTDDTMHNSVESESNDTAKGLTTNKTDTEGLRNLLGNEKRNDTEATSDNSIDSSNSSGTASEKSKQDNLSTQAQNTTTESTQDTSQHKSSSDDRNVTRTDNLTATNEYDSAEYHRSETVARDVENTGSKEGTRNTTNPTEKTSRQPNNLTETVTPNTARTELYSDTPQNGLTAVEEGKYLTNARVIKEAGGTTTTHSGSEDTVKSFDGDIEEKTNDTDESTTHEVTEHVQASVQLPDKYGNADGNNGMDTHLGSDTTKNTGTQTTQDDNTHTEDGTENISGTDTTKSDITNSGMQSNERSATQADNSTSNHLGNSKKEGSSTANREDTETSHNITDNKGTTESDSSHSSTQSTNGIANSKTSGDASSKMKSYVLSAEMLARAEPILAIVWNYFDDIFMQLIGGFY